ncbi:SGNH/GDSL hydrolase family protein [Microbacterium sp. LRZ72]|uniref:SGNH/GDSL hydrolase family protein n=1 Tax=Microbacterium sp. LRZ72 TaxID=2942481 RepID=UPI0029A11A0E|nr:SGNH/GDSL hydrolase family protein [Microbacterium sp. LRZ72]MDX2377340.1 SGNH/GDSL hydrolase family protein [Microbacterium sp. LRZ72]
MPRSRPRIGVVVGLLAVVATAVVVGYAQQGTRVPVAVDAAAAESAPAPLSVAADARVLVFGDSWTYGSAAAPLDRGYAYVLAELTGWNTIVDGVRGSGYLRAGIDGPDYGSRIAALDPALEPEVIVVQGSINDRLLVPEGYRTAVTSAWDALAARYPTASIVVLGPAPHVLPIDDGTVFIDTELAALAAERDWWYISPLQESWITAANYLSVIDTGAGRNHPSTEGHAYLADRLAQALGERTVVTDAVGDSEPGDPGDPRG